MSYYDIDAILTDAQKVPCTFEITIPGLGYLEGNSNTDIKQGTRVELPLWLAEMLGVSQRLGTEQNVVTLDLPPALAPRVQNALKADPCTVDLRSLASHYYSLGERILGLLEEDELVDILSETFKKRAAGIADHAHNPQGVISSGGEFLKGLDENERQLFKTAHESAKAIRAFLSDRSSSKK
ncbi:GINS complex, Psf3 component [Tuber magnatum]|uniref:DNA replication complex GINS protein PSF3 n=1 Tax=Tuber magnatum TaxID=42249 RepID=A0A317STU4_9PEZI|nr:GINS complex, Psf3 component [Tuber magnatum]